MTATKHIELVKILSLDEVAEIEARANAATKSPWEQRFVGASGFTVWATAVTRTGSMQIAAFGHAEGFDKDNAGFTAHARTDIPALCATVRALEAELSKCAQLYSDANGRLLEDLAAARTEVWKEAIETVNKAAKDSPVFIFHSQRGKEFLMNALEIAANEGVK